MAEPDALSSRKTFIVLVIVAGCFAVIWPRIITPLFTDNAKEQIRPNKLDKATGCCDMFYETDINAIRIMTEVCSSILEKQNENLDKRTKQAIQSGKLPKDVIAKCRKEVNATCGIDIATLLDQNVKLGKSYKQILDAVRSYNGSSCLKTHFGVSPWELGVSHYMSSGWVQDSLENVKQERPPHLHTSAQHPAMRERGRTIMPGAVSDSRPSPPSAGPVPLRREGRPPPVPGMRPPMGGAGHVVPAPKSSSVGFIMPLYTIAMVIFFFYTLCRLVFKKTGPNTEGPYTAVEPDPTFRRRVFEDTSNRHSPETNRLVVNAISGLVAEVRQQMEESYMPSHNRAAQEKKSDSTHTHTNGSVKKVEKEPTPEKELASERNTTQEYTSQYQGSPPRVEEHQSPDSHREYSPKPREYTPPPRENSPSEYIPQPRKESPNPKEPTPPPKEQTPEREKIQEKRFTDEIEDEKNVQSEEEYSDEEISYEEDELPSEKEEPLKPIRTSAEPENKTVKPAAEVSSIFLEGSLPHQSRLLVADSETHTQNPTTNGKGSPVILSGKMTLSVINDEGQESPERATEELAEVGADDDHMSSIPVSSTPEEHNEKEELSDDWLEEVIEESEEDQEAVIVPQTEEEIFVSKPKEKILVPQQDEELEEEIGVMKHAEISTQREQTEDKHFLSQPEKDIILPLPDEVEETVQDEVVEEIEEKLQLEVDESEEEYEEDKSDEEDNRDEHYSKLQIEKQDADTKHIIEEDQVEISDEEMEEEDEEEVDEEYEEEIEEPEVEKHHEQKDMEEKEQESEEEIAEKHLVQKKIEKNEQDLKERIESEKYENVHREQEVEDEELEDEEIEEEVEEEEVEVSESESEEEEEKIKVVGNNKKVNGTK